MIKYILSILLLSNTVFAEGYRTNTEAERDASRAIGEAFYKQSGMEKDINNYIKNTIPKQYEKTISNVTLVVNTIVKQRIDVKWEF